MWVNHRLRPPPSFGTLKRVSENGDDAMTIYRSSSRPNWCVLAIRGLAGAIILLGPPVHAQELEIRRWNHLPIDRNFVTANYARTEGDIAFDPVLRIEDAAVEMDTCLLGYIRTFEFLDKTARVEIRQPWQSGSWTGVLDGTPTSISREGLADAFVRFAVNLVGAPPLTGKDFTLYRAAAKVETIVGAALGVQIPTGEYLEDKLINLGTNRFTFRPQIGVNQQYYNWSFEGTAMVSIYTDNTSFFKGNLLEQDPYYTIDGSIEYSFASGIWVSAGAGFGVGARSAVNGVEKDDYKEDYAWSVSAGFPVTRSLGFKATYIQADHWAEVGTTSQTVGVGLVGTW